LEGGLKKMPLPNVSVVTVNFNSKKFLKNFFSSLYNLNYPKNKLEILMVDNNPLDGSADYTRKHYPRVRVIRNHENNYCKANNLGIKTSKGTYVAIVNNDTTVDKTWLTPLVDALTQDKRVAAAGSKILFMDGKIQSTGHQEFPYHYWADRGFLEEDHRQFDKTEEVLSISNCSALYRRKALERVGFFDEDFNMYMEDVDILFRMRKKRWKIVYVPQSRIYHTLFGAGQNEGERKFQIEKNRLLFVAKHFPDDLSTMVFGTGEISKFSDDYIRNLTSAVFMKLVKQYGKQKAEAVFRKMQENLSKVTKYNEHCARTELKQHISSIEALDQQLNAQQSIISEKDQELKIRQEAIGARDRRLSVQEGVISEKEKQISSQQDAITHKDLEIASFALNINDLTRQLEGLNRELQSIREQFSAQQARLSEKEKEIGNQQQAIAERDLQLNSQQGTIAKNEQQLQFRQEAIGARDRKLSVQEGVISEKEKQISSQQNIIAMREEEIAKIFQSKTYRFIVRPLIWPAFSLVKKFNLLRIIRMLPTKINRKIFVSRLLAESSEAAYLRENKYLIKIINKESQDAKVTLMFDIWPYKDRYHPQRHFAYLSTEITLKAKSATEVTLIYDWNDKFVFLANGHGLPHKDFWLGTMRTIEMYAMEAVVADVKNGKCISKLDLLQKLNK